MSENILYSFAKDLSQLYAKTQIKKIENCFLKVAQALDSEVEKWLQKAVQQDYKSSLQNPEVLDTLIVLARIKKSYPTALNVGEITKIFMNDKKLEFFYPLVLAVRDASSGSDFAILSPYRGILDATRGASNKDNPPPSASFTNDLRTLDNQFREEMERKVNREFVDDRATTNKRKITKQEKIGNLLSYLTRRFAEEVSMAFEEAGQMDVIGIAEDDTVLMNPMKIMQTMFPNYSTSNFPSLIKMAKGLTSEVLKIPEAQYYDHIYNSIKSRIMMESAFISSEKYNTIKYEAVLKFHTHQDDEAMESDNTGVAPSVWLYPNNLMRLSVTLFTIASKIR